MAEAARKEDWPQTVAEFQAWHERQPERWEFIDGQPRLLAPGSMTHTIIKGNVFRTLDRALGNQGCTALIDGAQILSDEISAVPDVVVTCVPIDLSTPAVAQPIIIVEVMSPGSQADDTGRKWQSYQKISALAHYIVISQDRRLVQIHTRAGDFWRERFTSTGTVELDDPRVTLEIDALYAATDLAA